jgi:2-dehydro-3-deoxyphosphogluconate aldolase/(4S)-4-hydroxy-2-oxoglutarate aldolase
MANPRFTSSARSTRRRVLRAGAAALGVGADLVDIKTIREGHAALITERAKRFIEIVREARES